MFRSSRTRGVARLLVITSAIGVGALVACIDVPSAPQEPDEAFVRVQAAMEVQLLDGATPRLGGSGSTTSTLRVPVLPARSGDSPAPSFAKAPGKRHTRFSQVNDSAGNVLTLGFVGDSRDAPPKRVYGFKNGVVQFVYSPTYRRVTGGWMRTRATLIVFDSTGRPVAKVKSNAVESAKTSALLRPAADAVRRLGEIVLPRTAHAQLQESDECLRAFIYFMGYHLGTIGGGFATVALLATCPTLSPTCLGGIATGGGTLLSFAGALEALDTLIRCERNRIIRADNFTNTTPSGTQKADNTSTTYKPLEDFMDAAEENGTVWCSEDGTTCLYFEE